jgi:hypothetical protein
LADKIEQRKCIFGIGIFSIVYGGMGFNHNRYVFFGLLLFTESMPQQVKESQSMDQQYQRKKKDTATAIGNYSAFKAFHHAGQFLDLIWYQFGADVTL